MEDQVDCMHIFEQAYLTAEWFGRIVLLQMLRILKQTWEQVSAEHQLRLDMRLDMFNLLFQGIV